MVVEERGVKSGDVMIEEVVVLWDEVDGVVFFVEVEGVEVVFGGRGVYVVVVVEGVLEGGGVVDFVWEVEGEVIDCDGGLVGKRVIVGGRGSGGFSFEGGCGGCVFVFWGF